MPNMYNPDRCWRGIKLFTGLRWRREHIRDGMVLFDHEYTWRYSEVTTWEVLKRAR